MIEANAISDTIKRARKQAVAEIKNLTRAKTAVDWDDMLPVWREMSDPKVLEKILAAPNREKAIAAACKRLRLPPASNGVNLLAALNRFRAYHNFLQYVTTVEEAHEQSWGWMMERCPVGFFGKK